MYNASDSTSCQDINHRAQRVDRILAIPEPLRSACDSLSSEDIDAQIRWFFENALERKPPRI
jgi:hypothetical protein